MIALICSLVAKIAEPYAGTQFLARWCLAFFYCFPIGFEEFHNCLIGLLIGLLFISDNFSFLGGMGTDCL